MNIIWLGHGSWRIEIGNQVLLIDPWLEGNPSFPEARRAEAIQAATAILVTHGHFDHIAGVPELAKELGVACYGVYDLMSWWEKAYGSDVVPFHRGGTVTLGDVQVTMVPASHSSSVGSDDGPIYAGAPAGFMIRGEGRCVYASGDTDVTAEMGWMGEYYAPDIGILSAGGHFTMDMKAAAWAAAKYFDFKTVIPGHYKTFPILEQSAEALKAGLPGVDVVEPDVLVPIPL